MPDDRTDLEKALQALDWLIEIYRQLLDAHELALLTSGRDTPSQAAEMRTFRSALEPAVKYRDELRRQP